MVESRVLKIKNGTIYLDENGHIMIDEVRKENVITTDFTELMNHIQGMTEQSVRAVTALVFQ